LDNDDVSGLELSLVYSLIEQQRGDGFLINLFKADDLFFRRDFAHRPGLFHGSR
jgi:hypothetical protein